MERIGRLSKNLMLFRPRLEKLRIKVWREVDLWRDMRLREKEREFGRRREEATIRGGGCDEPALPIWACLRRAFLVDTLALEFSFLFQFYL